MNLKNRFLPAHSLISKGWLKILYIILLYIIFALNISCKTCKCPAYTKNYKTTDTIGRINTA